MTRLCLKPSEKVCFIVILLLTACCSTVLPEKQLTPTLLISFDGFRYDYLDRVDTPHFDSLITNGVKAEGLIPVVPSKTFPNHYSIVTGLYPEHSGLIANTMYDPKWDEWYRVSDRQAVENPDWYEGEPIWNTLEKQGIRTGTMFWVGSEAPIQNMRPTYWKRYDDSISPEARIDTVVKWLSYPEGSDVDFATLYFDHVDIVGHRFGLKADTLDAAIQYSDQLVGYLKQRLSEAGLWGNINIIIVSDHGMADLSADKIITLDAIIDFDDVKRIIWDPVTFIQPKEGRHEHIYKALKENERHYRVYRKEELPKRYHFGDHRRTFDIVLVADQGYKIIRKEDRPRFVKSLPAATHGYDNTGKAMQALFVAAGPAFSRGERVEAFKNIHIYELLNAVMGTEPVPNDGSLDSVKVLLQ